MQIILLERVPNLGQMGDVVTVKPGFARNFLLPQGKALRATKDNVARFETQKAQLEAQNLAKKGEAEAVAEKMAGLQVVLIRQASEKGQLYGSVSARDIADAITEAGSTVARGQIELNHAIKTLGVFPIEVVLHPEVSIDVEINVARTAEEAELQAAGETIESRAAAEEAAADAEAAAMFEGAGSFEELDEDDAPADTAEPAPTGAEEDAPTA